VQLEALESLGEVGRVCNALPLVMLENTHFQFMLVERMVDVVVAVEEGLNEDLQEGPPLVLREDAVLLDVCECEQLQHLLVANVEIPEGQEEVLLRDGIPPVE